MTERGSTNLGRSEVLSAPGGETPRPVRVYIHIVTFNSRGVISHALRSIEEAFQRGSDSPYSRAIELAIGVLDNGSTDGTPEELQEFHTRSTLPLAITYLRENLGFAGGQNVGVASFLARGDDLLLVMNPDLALTGDTIAELAVGLLSEPSAGAATPRLLRCDADLRPLSPPVLDAAGMVFTESFRHFDRGSSEVASGRYTAQRFVAGGTGALLMLTQSAVRAVVLPHESEIDPDGALFTLYPALASEVPTRTQLFDEGFFAYREDADLSLRLYRHGFRTLYVPTAVAYHRRTVTPDRRRALSKEINALGVRNRFLLQVIHGDLALGWKTVLNGLILRNITVLLAVLLTERSSLRGIAEFLKLLPRARKLREILSNRDATPNNLPPRARLFKPHCS